MKKFFVFMFIVMSLSILKAQVTQDPNDEIIWEVKIPGDQAFQPFFHPNGKYVFCSNDKVIFMYSIETASIVRQFSKGGSVMALSKDGSMLAVVSDIYNPLKLMLGVIRIYDTETGKEISTFIDSTSVYAPKYYSSVSFSPDGTKIVATGRYYDVDNGFSMVRLIDIKTNLYNDIGQSIYQTSSPNFPKSKYINYQNVIFSNDGNSIYASSTNVCQVKKFDSLGFKRRTVVLDQGFINDSESYRLSQTKSGKYLVIGLTSFWGIYDLEINKFVSNPNFSIIPSNAQFNKFDTKSIALNSKLAIYNFSNPKDKYVYNFHNTNNFNVSEDERFIITTASVDTLRLVKAK